MNKKILILGIVLVLIVVVLLGVTQTSLFSLYNEQDVVVGVIYPLSGDAAIFGTEFSKVAIMARDEINANGGVNGKKLNLIFEDGQCDAKASIDATNKLINIDNVKIINGGICSGETLAIAPIAEQNKVILFSPGSGSPEITNSGDYIFRNMASDAYSGIKIADNMIKNNEITVAIISENTDYPKALAKVFRERYSELGGKILVDETFGTEDKDFRTIITKVIALNPDVIYLNPQTPQTLSLLLKQLEEFDYKGKLYGNEYVRSNYVLENNSKQIEGIIFAETVFDENNSYTRQVLQKMQDQNIEMSYTNYLAQVYDSIYILTEAIDFCNTDKNTDCIRDYLYSIKERKGAQGVLTIDADGDAVLDFELKTIKDGNIVKLQ